jgi:hypothetical protein
MSPPYAAAIAFLFHVPGLRLFTTLRPSRDTLITNAIAVLLTIAASVAASFALGWIAAVAVFAVGHFGWSVWLAVRAYRSAIAGAAQL